MSLISPLISSLTLPKAAPASSAVSTDARGVESGAAMPSFGPSPSFTSSPAWLLPLLALLGGGLLAVTIGLWVHFGSTVFFEVVRTGWSACF